MVYMALLTAEHPLPSLEGTSWIRRFRSVFEPQSGHTEEYGCAYSTDPPPSTCANLLRCNRQIYAEMSATIYRARRKGLLSVKLDCIAQDESFHYFTFLAVPLVETTTNANAVIKRMPAWADGMMRRYSGNFYRRPATLIKQLWVDIRLQGDRSFKFSRNSSAPERTSWAICAALKRIFEKGPNFADPKSAGNQTTVEELVLNVVSPPNVPKERYLAEDYPADGIQKGVVHPRTVARELVNVWQRIWSGDDFKGVFYQMLLERIKTVRVCVDSDTFSKWASQCQAQAQILLQIGPHLRKRLHGLG